ncbi:MAG TPA: ABC transporter permease [Bryobacteraceae bacterium]|nr:ABC transporter permease [Bryobacteraceae bacterium]
MFWRSKREKELEEELQSHLNMAEQDRAARGDNPAEAADSSRKEFGNVGLVKEVTRDMWRWTAFERFGQDLRYGLRLMARSKGFTAVAVLSLALGIGANTAIFSVLDALLLKRLPVPHPEQLYTFGYKDAGVSFEAYPTYEKFRQVPGVFDGIAAICLLDRSNITINGTGGGLDSATVRVGLVSGTYFSMLQVQPITGRTLTADDDRVPGGHPVAVISYDYWQRRFYRAPDVVGRSFTLNGTTYSILGVTQPGFAGDWIGLPTDVWIPIAMQSQVMLERPGLLNNPNPPWIRIVARLKPGVPVAQAEAALQVASMSAVREMRNLTPRMLDERLRVKVSLEPSSRGFSMQRTTFQQPLLILMVTVGLVLLIACANVANLLLARSAARQREMAVRLAVGAGRGQILRQLLTESVLLSTLGGAFGILFAIWGTNALLKFVGTGLPELSLDLHPDARMLFFALGLCLVTGILFGLAPAARSARVSVSPSLAGRGADSGGSAGRFGFGKMLVVVQVALSLVLLIGAGLFARSLRNLKTQDVGFDRDHVLLVWTAPDHEGRQGPNLASLYEAVLERINAVPGVRSASPSAFGVLGGHGGSPVPHVEGYTPKPQEEPFVPWSLVSPGYFDTAGIKLLLGRDFTLRDRETAPRVAIVNETMARYYFGDRNPVGKHFGMRRDPGTPIEIVGVVRDAKYTSAREKNTRMIYIPYRQDLTHLFAMCVVVRTAGNSQGVTGRVRDELRSIDASLPILKIDTAEDQLNDSLVEERLIAALSGFFGVLAVLLACLGLYGVMAYTAARRTNEIGIRLALGASNAGVLSMVLKESMWLVIAGIAIGVPVTLAATRLIATKLFGVSPTDPATIAVATSLMLAIAALAGFLPARRASRVDPMVALRYD